MKLASSTTTVRQLVTVLLRDEATMDGQDAYWQYQQPPQSAAPLHFSSPQTTAYSSSRSPPNGAVPAVYPGNGLEQPYASTSAYVFSADPQPPPPSSLPTPQVPTYAFLGQYDGVTDYTQHPGYVYASQPHGVAQQEDFATATVMNGEAQNGEGTYGEKLSNARMSKKPKPRPPPPQGAIVTDKSCARCRVRKGAVLPLRAHVLSSRLFVQSAVTASFRAATIARQGTRTATSKTGNHDQNTSPTILRGLRSWKSVSVRSLYLILRACIG